MDVVRDLVVHFPRIAARVLLLLVREADPGWDRLIGSLLNRALQQRPAVARIARIRLPGRRQEAVVVLNAELVLDRDVVGVDQTARIRIRIRDADDQLRRALIIHFLDVRGEIELQPVVGHVAHLDAPASLRATPLLAGLAAVRSHVRLTGRERTRQTGRTALVHLAGEVQQVDEAVLAVEVPGHAHEEVWSDGRIERAGRRDLMVGAGRKGQESAVITHRLLGVELDRAADTGVA